MSNEIDRTYVDVPYKDTKGQTREWRVQSPGTKALALDIAVGEIKSFRLGRVIAKASQLKIKRHPLFRSHVMKPS